MRPIPSSRFAVLALTAGLSLLLVAPVAAQSAEPVIDPAPVVLPAPSHIMGSGGVGSPHEAFVLALASVAAPSWDTTSGYGAVETSRASLAVPAAPSWDATSGYGAVEVSRAATAQHELGTGGLGRP